MQLHDANKHGVHTRSRQAGGSLQAARICVCTWRRASALHGRAKTFDMAFGHLSVLVSWKRYATIVQMDILKMRLPAEELFLSRVRLSE